MEQIVVEDPETQYLRNLVSAYEKMKWIRLVRWFHPYRQKLATWIKQWTAGVLLRSTRAPDAHR